MKCLRCGFCCVVYRVPIPINLDMEYDSDFPQKDIKQGNKNVIEKQMFSICPHLIIHDRDNLNCSCSIHDREWFKYTSCGKWTQWENDDKEPCRLGQLVLLWKDYFRKYYTDDKAESIKYVCKDSHKINKIVCMCQYLEDGNGDNRELFKQQLISKGLLENVKNNNIA